MLEILEKLKKAVLEYDREAAENWARKAVDEGLDPVEALDALTDGIKIVGDQFARGELWLPELIGAATAMQHAMPIIEEEMKREEKQQKTGNLIVIGTVKGDIHDIGKNIVALLLQIGGFRVIDLGVDVSAERFLKAIVDHEPDILALSALLTMTAPEQKRIIDTLEKENMRHKVKVIVGGAPITQDFANRIGADGYSPTAVGAVKLAKELTEK